MTINSQALSDLLSGNENIKLDALSSGDWEILARQAMDEGVAPLAYWTLAKSGKISALPQSIHQTLRAAYSQTWQQNQAIFNELEILAHEFNRANIPVVILKGACFALTIYPDIGVRPMGDLDLLVPAVKLNEAAEIAKKLGYVNDLPEASPGLTELFGHAAVFYKKDIPAIVLEIHNSLVADKTFKYAVPVDWFWSQTESLNHARFPDLLVLSPTAQVLYASAHAMLQHGGRLVPLRWFVDIDHLIRFYDKRMDWDLLLSQARAFEWGSALDAALAQTQLCFGTPIPARVRAELSAYNDRHKGLVEYLKNKPSTRIQEEQQKLKSLNTYGKIRLLFALIFPSPAYMRWRYQLKTPWALAVYYPLRWWGILKDGTHTLIVLIQKKSSS